VKGLLDRMHVICAIALPTFAQQQADSYPDGKIVAVDRISDHHHSAGRHQTGSPTDAPLAANVAA
jgi:hypothetical protein